MGNIRSKTDGSVTHLYTYGNSQWADLLTAYDGHSITYDGSGNPLSYYNGADYTFTWEQGRQLASVTKGNKTASYTYDMSGVRSSKTVNGVSYEYMTLSGKITRMTWSGNAVDIVYEDAGRPYILRYTPSGGATQTYYYVLNLQGDVVGLMNTSMQMVVKYSYDPWGKLTGTTATSAYVALAQANPLRYRSYCYDIETGFYYLQTRYYDPTIARFINADGYLSTGATGLLSHNMFAYCENNPIMCSDPTGESTKVTDIETICYKVDDDGTAYYSTAISFETKLKCRNYDYYRPTVTVSGAYVFEYKIDANGVIRFDNNQPDSSSLQNPIICKALAKEMRNISRKQVHGALKGRTVDGIARELKYHKIANWFLPSLESAKVTDIGALYKNSIGYDYNAKLFENGDFIATIKEMLK